ncbi:putative Pilus assembly protein TadB [uncultured Thiomicrorhabdus sp.]
MESIELFKALIALMSAVAGITIYKLNQTKSLKTRADLVEQFQKALTDGQKYSVMEMFYLLHGLRMTYEDIQALCEDSNASHIIYSLQKTPGMVKYKDSSFQYTEIFQKSWFRKLNRWVYLVAVWMTGLITFGLMIASIFAPYKAAIAIFILLIPFFTYLTFLLRDMSHDKLIESLVPQQL